MQLKDYLSKDELAYFTRKSDLRAAGMFLFTWASIFAVLAIPYVWTNPLTILLAIVLLGGRQLALAVLMHDCGHNTLFRTKWMNSFFGQYFAANVAFTDLHGYARGHLRHHQKAGTDEDPDLKNYRQYPISRDSFMRKVKRDLTGKTGMKLISFVLRGAKAYSKPETREFAKPFVQELAVQLVFFIVLSVLMAPWVYLLWFVSYITTHMFIVRLRQVAEHAAVPDLYDLDPRKNTRTTLASWWERLLFAPNYVNYHMEHHCLASVPCYRLKELHELLKGRGAYDDTPIANGYADVLRAAVVN